MKIPACCKNCNNRNKGPCNCVLPNYCNEWVEDEPDKIEPIPYIKDAKYIGQESFFKLPCQICGELIDVTNILFYPLCGKCKKAVLKLREKEQKIKKK